MCQLVNLIDFHSNGTSLNPAEVNIFSVKMLFETSENKQKRLEFQSHIRTH